MCKYDLNPGEPTAESMPHCVTLRNIIGNPQNIVSSMMNVLF